MNPAHLHLMLNHLPVVGLALALVFLGWGLARRNQTLTKTSLATLVAIALLAILAFLTGEPAEGIAERLPEVSKPFIEKHEEAAQIAFVATLVAGVAALASLWLFRAKAVALWCSSSVLPSHYYTDTHFASRLQG
jgi:uncharacterized membrane protein